MDRAAHLRQDGAMRRVVLAVLGLAVAFVVVTLGALEGREVVVLRTRAADGSARATRTWIADADGAAWVEAANPERPFLHDLERDPTVVVDRDGRAHRCRGTIAPNPDGHARIRDLLSAKYGWADRWIALVADTKRSLAVRIDCDETHVDADARGPAFG
jgi:hypothetical protein